MTYNPASSEVDLYNNRETSHDMRLHVANLTKLCHSANHKWWCDPATQLRLPKESFNVGEKLMLVVTELAEGMEGYRKGLPDDKLPQYPMLTVELADALIRIFDLAGGLELDLSNAFVDKMAYNATRADHSFAHRLAEGGKKF